MTEPATSTPVMLHQPRVPPTFHGYPGDDPEDWIDNFERVATFNRWEDEMKLCYVFFSLDGPARTWYKNHETTLKTWKLFKSEVVKAFTNILRKEKAQMLLDSRMQHPNETVSMYVEEMQRLFRRADPNMTEEKKTGYLMRGVKESLFGGLVRNPPKTVAEFAEEASTIEKTLDACTRQYNRPPQVCSSFPDTTTTTSDLREIIREIAREELRRLLPSSSQPQVASLTEVVREEVRHALGSPSATTEPQAPAMSYVAAVRKPAPRRATPSPIRREPAVLDRRPPGPAHPTYEQRSGPRKCDTWRTRDNRPLCFHCGEAGHVLRHCPFRRIGLRGFAVDAPRPRSANIHKKLTTTCAATNTCRADFPAHPRREPRASRRPATATQRLCEEGPPAPVGETENSNLRR
ncbi:hypothetical protein V5799_013234 [Amblyomma americanum]|uniref:CCHC-type domain-containing protein n=1 Tax=Amblyomma americanum TaxID=6943 RepID=A0AAQ4E6L8_AMBAM